MLNGQLPQTIANAMAGGAGRGGANGFVKTWQYNRAGMIATRQDRVQGSQHYQYDPLGRLIASSNQAPSHPQPEGKRIPKEARAALTQAYRWDAASNALPASAANAASTAATANPGQAANDAAAQGLPANPLASPNAQGAAGTPQHLRVLHTSLTPSNSNGLVQKNRVVVWQDIRYHYDSLGRVTRKISGQRQDLRSRPCKIPSPAPVIASSRV